KGYLDMVWQDPRLAFDPAKAGTETKVYVEDDAELMREKIWWPDIEFANEVKAQEPFNQELLIFANGRVEYRERFAVSLATTYEMRSFPFDRQGLRMEIEPFAWTSSYLALRVKKNVVGFSPRFFMPGWKILNVEEKIREHKEPRDRAPFSEFEAIITVRR